MIQICIKNCDVRSISHSYSVLFSQCDEEGGMKDDDGCHPVIKEGGGAAGHKPGAGSPAQVIVASAASQKLDLTFNSPWIKTSKPEMSPLSI